MGEGRGVKTWGRGRGRENMYTDRQPGSRAVRAERAGREGKRGGTRRKGEGMLRTERAGWA